MLIGVLSDIHGNSVALEQVLKEADIAGVEHFLILGDLVGYYYDAEAVFSLLRNKSKDTIRGNHEDMLLGLIDRKLDPELIRQKYGSGLSVAANSLSSEIVNEIVHYKTTMKLMFDDLTILICHGSPFGTNEYVYPDADLAILKNCERSDVDYVFMGHTHYSFSYHGDQSMIINPGSVGQSRARGGIAEWGILNTSNKVYVARQTVYDTEVVIKMAEKLDPDVPYLVNVLKRIR